ncbi:MAG: copper resistance protein CopA [Rhodospirillales bacterium 20-64-7]|nr:MAG: copper resistance protein CopA [Rhodospirillales bacterium 20-64-7]
MEYSIIPPHDNRSVTRRRFVQGVAASGVLAGVGWPLRRALADTRAPLLTGTHFDLEIDDAPVNITGRPATATVVNGSLPAPILRWHEGDTVTLAVTNRLKEPTSIHWHGVRSPSPMDGVPGLSFPGIAPGETFVYRIPVHQSGTYWYHSHSGFQEQTGLYGAIIIDPAAGYAEAFDRDYVVLLSDWSDTSPETIVSNLKMQSDYYNYGQRTAGTFFHDVAQKGLGATVSDRMEWGKMRMSPTDILDVNGSTYTYLINGQPPGANWTALFKPGERVRLRFINGSSMSIFDVRIPGLTMKVVQNDGNDVEPVEVDEFRIGTAETYDVIVQPKTDQAFTIFAQAEDRSGFARGTLTPKAGLAAPVPPMDPRPMRTMADMGMAGMMGHRGMSDMKMDDGSMAGMKMGHDHDAMPGMKMNKGSMSGMKMDNGSMPGMKMDDGGMAGMKMGSGTGSKLKEGVEVDNIAMMPQEDLQKPGGGLGGHGRRVLTYTDLRALKPGSDPRPPSREITLHLTGNMQRFIWGFDGKKYSEAEPIELMRNERVRFVLINDSMMEHPIHLHGLWSELENGQGDYRPYKHTVLVKPGERLSYLVTADAPGRWAYHCHLLYHMEMGMFREVHVA